MHSDGILSSPLSSSVLISGSIILVEVCNLRHERVIGVGVGEQGADGQQDLGNSQSRGPLVFENVETDAAVRVDVGVVDLGGEADLWGLEGVVCREVDRQEKDTVGVGAVRRSHNGSLPVEKIVSNGASGAGRGRVTTAPVSFLSTMNDERLEKRASASALSTSLMNIFNLHSEIREFLVDTLKSHVGLCGVVCV